MLAHAIARNQTKAAPHRANASARAAARPAPRRPARADDAWAPPAWDFTELPLFAPERAIGPRAVAPPPLPLQAKLAIGPVDDPLEREADRAAEKVMRMAEPAPVSASSPLQLSRQCAACEEEEQQNLQKKSAGALGPQTVPPIVHEVLRSPGQPLDAKTSRFFEPRFGYDFGRVRIHHDHAADAAARSVSALAFTVGRDIVFRSGAYAPGSSETRRLLAHELAHTVQQRGAEPRPIRAPHLATPAQTGDAVAQRQGDGPADEQKPHAGAPAMIQWRFDPVPDDTAPSPGPVGATDGQATVQRSTDASDVIRRQTAPTPAGSGAGPLVAQTLSWPDFAPVPNPIGGESAQTGYISSWHNDGTGFSIAFDPAHSWSVVADQTDALLRHEQYHLNLAVLVANKANAAAGTMRPAALIRAFQTTLSTHENSYDGDTDHSQNTRLQTLWEQDIDAGVPQFPFTP